MPNLPIIRIGTRKSPLALAQANLVSDRLRVAWPGLEIELVPFVTSGDRFLDEPLSAIEGNKGLFTKEIEEAMLVGDIHIAVHSMKDMPTVLPDGLVIGAMLEREDPRDVLVGQGVESLASLPPGAVVGTSSLRRTAQLKIRRPDLEVTPLRGNVQSRLDKLLDGKVQAVMLAKAGLNRLGLLDVQGAALPAEDFLPAVAQGAIGIECREYDAEIRALLAALSHLPTEMAVNCERAFLRVLDGSCRTPIAGYAILDKGELHFHGLVAKPDGSQYHEVRRSGSAAAAETLGEEAARELLARAGEGFLG